MIGKKPLRDRLKSSQDIVKILEKSTYLDYENERRYERDTYPSPSSIHKKIRTALITIGNTELLERIDVCFYNPFGSRYLEYKNLKVCGSHYCSGCRNRLALFHLKKVKDQIDIGSTRSPYDNDNLRHISGVLGICRLDEKSLDLLFREEKNRFRRINRKLQKEKEDYEWIELAYELELLNWKYLLAAEGSDYKKQQVRFLIDKFGEEFTSEPFLYVHFHGLTSLNKEQISRVFDKEYFFKGERIPKTNNDTGLFIQELHKDKSLEKNVKRITSYPFKNAIRYKHSFLGSSYTAGEPFTHEELAQLITIHNYVYGRQGKSYYRSLSNRTKPTKRRSPKKQFWTLEIPYSQSSRKLNYRIYDGIWRKTEFNTTITDPETTQFILNSKDYLI